MPETEKILKTLLERIITLNEVKSIGISGSKLTLPKVGEGDIDIFIYCDIVPETKKRSEILNQLSNLIHDININVIEGGHWGVGDSLLINGIEIWLMYFTKTETLSEIDSILKGNYPDKLDNYYYPIGRCAMLKNINIWYDKDNFLYLMKSKLEVYPDDLASKLINYHIDQLNDIEDLERAVLRKDVLFYHFAFDLALDHFLQALFAMNKTFFPSRKRSIEYIEQFNIKPENCSETLLEIIRLGSFNEGINYSYKMWMSLINDLKRLL